MNKIEETKENALNTLAILNAKQCSKLIESELLYKETKKIHYETNLSSKQKKYGEDDEDEEEVQRLLAKGIYEKQPQSFIIQPNHHHHNKSSPIKNTKKKHHHPSDLDADVEKYITKDIQRIQNQVGGKERIIAKAHYQKGEPLTSNMIKGLPRNDQQTTTTSSSSSFKKTSFKKIIKKNKDDKNHRHSHHSKQKDDKKDDEEKNKDISWYLSQSEKQCYKQAKKQQMKKAEKDLIAFNKTFAYQGNAEPYLTYLRQK
mmetsp:Transcript_27656/g.32729  ORF Transcript_27656/g.32729 Transcript_27656/m.32729 type:complete len:258 (-) Transcript_27656:101-874(-)